MRGVHFMSENGGERRAVAEVLFAAACWGCLGLFTRYLSGLGMSPLAIAFFRSFAAAAMLAGWLGVRDRKTFRIRARGYLDVCGHGLCLDRLLQCVLFYDADVHDAVCGGGASVHGAVFCDLYVAALFKERITRQKICAVVLAFAGCLFVTGLVGGGSVSLAPIAIVTGLGSAICYALYSIFGEVALARYAPMTVTFYSLFISACSMGIVFAASGADLPPVSGGMVLGICGLGLFSTALPYIFYTRGLAGLSPSKASVLAFAEPMVATLVGIFVLHEPITLPAVLGIALIFAGIVVLNRRSS